MNPPSDYLRLRTRPRPETPPQGCVDLYHDAASGSFVRKDASGVSETILSSKPTGITGASAVTNIVSISQDAYDTLASTDASTLYVITA